MKNDTVKIDRAEYEALMAIKDRVKDLEATHPDEYFIYLEDAFNQWLKATAQRRAGEMF